MGLIALRLYHALTPTDLDRIERAWPGTKLQVPEKTNPRKRYDLTQDELQVPAVVRRQDPAAAVQEPAEMAMILLPPAESHARSAIRDVKTLFQKGQFKKCAERCMDEIKSNKFSVCSH